VSPRLLLFRMSVLPKKKAGRPRTSTRPEAARTLARYWFPLAEKCERCETDGAVDRHHKDGDPFNNVPENIASLCRRCHMEVDGRLHRKRVKATHCKYGHEFTADNTYVTPSTGKRGCRICRARLARKHEVRRTF
jgi:hypothetical protein